MMWKSLARLAAALLALSLAATAARADVFRSGEFTLSHGENAGSYEFTATIPEASASPATPRWPEGCQQTGATRNIVGSRSHYSYSFSCDRDLGPSDSIATPWSLDGASLFSNIGGGSLSRSLTAGPEGISVPMGALDGSGRSIVEIAAEFLRQGVLHIWMGWDHLAFVLCLCMLARGRQLLGLVTAFTLGHSVSLALAFFQLVHVPVPPVEAIIALSIGFMAREALLQREQSADERAFRRQMAVVIAFGLLHGLGFASALEELGVVDAERVPALIFFNIGVEAGQLAFVGAVGALMAGLRSVSLAMPVRTAALYSVGMLGAFWMVERVAGFTMA